MSEQADVMEDLKQQAAAEGDAGPVLEGEYIPKAEAASAPEGDMPTGEVLAMLYSAGFELFAPAWGVSEAKINVMAEAHGKALDAWAPADWLSGKWGALLMAVIVTGAVLKPHIGQPRYQPPAPKSDDAS
jgi:hypothetical protein